MKRTIAFTTMCLAFSGWLCAQGGDPSVVAAGGGVATGKQVALEWTLGEAAVASATSPGLLLTEGFHQPFLTVEPVAETPFPQAEPAEHQQFSQQDASQNGASKTAFACSVAPNPVASTLFVRLEGAGGARLELTDAGGKILRTELLPAGKNQAEFDVSGLPPGTYFLRCLSLEGRFSQTFKVTKF